MSDGGLLHLPSELHELILHQKGLQGSDLYALSRTCKTFKQLAEYRLYTRPAIPHAHHVLTWSRTMLEYPERGSRVYSLAFTPSEHVLLSAGEDLRTIQAAVALCTNLVELHLVPEEDRGPLSYSFNNLFGRLDVVTFKHLKVFTNTYFSFRDVALDFAPSITTLFLSPYQWQGILAWGSYLPGLQTISMPMETFRVLARSPTTRGIAHAELFIGNGSNWNWSAVDGRGEMQHFAKTLKSLRLVRLDPKMYPFWAMHLVTITRTVPDLKHLEVLDLTIAREHSPRIFIDRRLNYENKHPNSLETLVIKPCQLELIHRQTGVPVGSASPFSYYEFETESSRVSAIIRLKPFFPALKTMVFKLDAIYHYSIKEGDRVIGKVLKEFDDQAWMKA
ncbi:hypothetical protein FA15DRAFT_669642 [Coprinopsis marcescibilis]|uniref:F-box domain-containing protein n=1 Tax=Coprinopsis marcescibilis TaxID=230819 RepID=A0A5C3KW18_COPMA|nr:hypothetical protein FA15DRAFT_669642 [Coprinopsis marcescibilis]